MCLVIDDLVVQNQDQFKRESIPIELKVLGVLRVLGRNSTFDCIAELTNSDEETHRKFFHAFNMFFVREYYNAFVSPPKDIEDVQRITNNFSQVGLPGCVGSIDCVHIPWERCPQIHKNMYIGKEGNNSNTYIIVTLHNTKYACVYIKVTLQ